MNGSELRSWYMARGMKQTEAADLLGVSPRRLRKYLERGLDDLPAVVAERVATLEAPRCPVNEPDRPDVSEVPPIAPRAFLDVLRADEGLDEAPRCPVNEPDRPDVSEVPPIAPRAFLGVLRADEGIEVPAPVPIVADEPDADPRATSARLAGWARRHGLTVPMLAAVLEVDGATVARWMSGPVVRLPRRVADRIRHLDPTGRLG